MESSLYSEFTYFIFSLAFNFVFFFEDVQMIDAHLNLFSILHIMTSPRLGVSRDWEIACLAGDAPCPWKGFSVKFAWVHDSMCFVGLYELGVAECIHRTFHAKSSNIILSFTENVSIHCRWEILEDHVLRDTILGISSFPDRITYRSWLYFLSPFRSLWHRLRLRLRYCLGRSHRLDRWHLLHKWLRLVEWLWLIELLELWLWLLLIELLLLRHLLRRRSLYRLWLCL